MPEVAAAAAPAVAVALAVRVQRWEEWHSERGERERERTGRRVDVMRMHCAQGRRDSERKGK